MTRTLGEPAWKRGQDYSLHAFSGLPTTQVEERRTLVPARWSKMRTGLHKQLNSCPRDWIMVTVVAAHPHNTAWQFDKGEQLQKERGKKKKRGLDLVRLQHTSFVILKSATPHYSASLHYSVHDFCCHLFPVLCILAKLHAYRAWIFMKWLFLIQKSVAKQGLGND